MFRVSSETVIATTMAAILTVIGYFLMETCNSIKGLEKDVITIREKVTVFEATRITRRDIQEMISDYHSNHPCPMGRNKQRSEK